jgi:hypothetical protein
MIAGILGTAPAASHVRAWPGPTLLGTAGRMLRDPGLHVALGDPGRNEEFCEIHTHLTITRPDRPRHGRVTLTDEGMIVWGCPLGPPDGLTAPDIAATIGAVLSRVQYPGHPGPATTRPLAIA